MVRMPTAGAEKEKKVATNRHTPGLRRPAMWRVTVAGLGMVTVLGLSGCAPQPEKPAPTTHLTTVPQPAKTSTTSTPLGSGIVDTVMVTAYPGTQFKAAHGCGCTLKNDSKEELFPNGTAVMLLKITLTGVWKPAQGKQTTQTVTGVSLSESKFDGRPENAVLDIKDGPRHAEKLGLPWLPAGLFAGKSAWTIQNDKPSAFAAAWYVPAGVNQLQLIVNIPSEGQPTTVTVTVPAEVLKLSDPSKG